MECQKGQNLIIMKLHEFMKSLIRIMALHNQLWSSIIIYVIIIYNNYM